MRTETVVVATRLPKPMGKRMNEALRIGPYLTQAEFLRAAVAEKLDRDHKKEVA